jgi:hypothetical protein
VRFVYLAAELKTVNFSVTMFADQNRWSVLLD